MDYLDILEAEAIFIFRETKAQFDNPVILFSGGKDSTVLVHLAKKAFFPHSFIFPILHIDTGHNFEEIVHFMDDLTKDLHAKIIVRKVADTIQKRQIVEAVSKLPSRNAIQSQTLVDAINELNIDACIGGGRRDEEKARAKERIFSKRDLNGAWQPYNQEPELWDIYNGRINKKENVRVFPISNWSEEDIWNYIRKEEIKVSSLYFSHSRKCIKYKGKLLAVSPHIKISKADIILNKKVRYRTIGDMSCTAAIESSASSIDDIIVELQKSKISERGETRLDDDISDAAMEDRKINGYF